MSSFLFWIALWLVNIDKTNSLATLSPSELPTFWIKKIKIRRSERKEKLPHNDQQVVGSKSKHGCKYHQSKQTHQ